MKADYSKERDFLLYHLPQAFHKLAEQGASQIRQKSAHDLVTEVDVNIEAYLSAAIRETFPGDDVHGEELSSDQAILSRTWTIDPIDGTCNFARQIPLFGVQCALFEEGEPVVGAIFLPLQQELLYAIRGQGCFCNGTPMQVNTNTSIDNAVISFGNYSRGSDALAAAQHRALGALYPIIGVARMFGASCIDLSFFFSCKTDGTILVTKNAWDLAPGLLMCQEAGAHIANLKGESYHYGDDGLIAGATEEIVRLLAESFQMK